MKDNSSRTSLRGFFKEHEQYYSQYMRNKLSSSPKREVSSELRGKRSSQDVGSSMGVPQYNSLRENSRSRLKSDGPISITNISLNNNSTSNFQNYGEQTKQQFEVQRLSEMERHRASRLSAQIEANSKAIGFESYQRYSKDQQKFDAQFNKIMKSPTEKTSYRTSIGKYAEGEGVTSPSGTSSQTKNFNQKYLNYNQSYLD